jgi:hypothetical protein
MVIPMKIHLNIVGTAPFRYMLTYNLKPPVIPKLAKFVQPEDATIGQVISNTGDVCLSTSIFFNI